MALKTANGFFSPSLDFVAKEAISVLKTQNDVFSKNNPKKNLLEDSSDERVYLQVTLKKIPPKKSQRMIKVNLPHSIMLNSAEVCLITGDLDKADKKCDIEPTVFHYKELLKKNRVNKIAKVVPLRQLRTEYRTYESKRELSAGYDLFVADKKILGCLPRVLGKAFYAARKFPVPINMETSNIKNQVERALTEKVFSLSCRGNSCTSEVARLSLKDEEILDNILCCIKTVAEKLPGKFENILGLYLKTAKSEAIPIYMSFETPNDVNVKKKK